LLDWQPVIHVPIIAFVNLKRFHFLHSGDFDEHQIPFASPPIKLLFCQLKFGLMPVYELDGFLFAHLVRIEDAFHLRGCQDDPFRIIVDKVKDIALLNSAMWKFSTCRPRIIIFFFAESSKSSSLAFASR
jgi:hypothetical protein